MGGLVIALILLVGPIIFAANVLATKNQLTNLPELLKAGDMKETAKSLKSVSRKLRWARTGLALSPQLNLIPGFFQEKKVLKNLLLEAENMVIVGEQLLVIGQNVLGLDQDDQVDLDAIKLEQSQIIVGLANSSEDIVKLQKEVEAIKLELERIDVSESVPTLQQAYKLFYDKTQELAKVLEQAELAARLVPGLAGYPKQKTYLFLFQNNTELRPSGGFLGSYGILNIKDGKILDFFTDDTYNLDHGFEQKITPPAPLAIYNQDKEWTFRDSNWWPDFPKSAEKMLEFYRLENGPHKDELDGIIAITPTFIENLLEILGPQKVEGYDYTFTAENFTDSLETHVELTYKKIGESKAERKGIIGKFGKQLIASLLDLPPEKLIQVLLAIQHNLSEKQIVIYSLDQIEQQQIIAEGWAGEFKNPAGDFVLVADSNIASLKTDPKVKRHLEYTITESGSDLKSKLEFTYDHQGDLDWRTTRYRTWVRIYVPLGSKLISARGNESRVETYTELGKTVFAFFKSIEPLTQEIFTLEYSLPNSIIKKDYSLYVQKQIGTVDYTLTTNLFGQKKDYSLAEDQLVKYH